VGVVVEARKKLLGSAVSINQNVMHRVSKQWPLLLIHALLVGVLEQKAVEIQEEGEVVLEVMIPQTL
jgi:hypothetical protein